MRPPLEHGNCVGSLKDMVRPCSACNFMTARCVDNGYHSKCIPMCGACWNAKSADQEWTRATIVALSLMTGELG